MTPTEMAAILDIWEGVLENNAPFIGALPGATDPVAGYLLENYVVGCIGAMAAAAINPSQAQIVLPTSSELANILETAKRLKGVPLQP